MGERRGWTIGWRGRNYVRITKPSHRVRFGAQWRPFPSVSFGWVIATWL